MVTILVFVMPNFSKKFVVEIDASGLCLEVVLMQSRRPIAYLSKTLSPQNKWKSVYKQELIAIMTTL